MEHRSAFGCCECSNGHNLLIVARKHDAPEGRELLRELPPMPEGLPLIMDRAYEGDETPQLVLGMVPEVSPKTNRKDPWARHRALYTKRNEIERLFRRIKGFRRITGPVPAL